MSNDILARLAALEAENAALKDRVAKSDAKAGERLQLNGTLTVPKGQRPELEGQRFECTVVLSGTFGRSHNQNVSARLTTKVPIGEIKIMAPAPAAE